MEEKSFYEEIDQLDNDDYMDATNIDRIYKKHLNQTIDSLIERAKGKAQRGFIGINDPDGNPVTVNSHSISIKDLIQLAEEEKGGKS